MEILVRRRLSTSSQSYRRRSLAGETASYCRLKAGPAVITPYADLDEVLAELLGQWQRILGENLAGAYVQGSFAPGSGDQSRLRSCPWVLRRWPASGSSDFHPTFLTPVFGGS